MPLSNPSATGDMLNQKDVFGHVLIVGAHEYHDHIPTVHTKPGEKSPAIRVDVIDFGNGDGTINPDSPVIYKDVLWFGVMAGACRRDIGTFVAARMGQGQASSGKNPPWQLESMETEADWMTFLGNFLDNTPIGETFQAEVIAKANKAAQRQSDQQQVAQAGQMAAPPAPAAAPPVAAPAAAPPVNRPPSAPPAAPAPAPAPAAAAPAGDLASQLSGLPLDELQKVMAAIAAQGKAAH